MNEELKKKLFQPRFFSHHLTPRHNDEGAVNQKFDYENEKN